MPPLPPLPGSPPADLDALQRRARALSGHALAELAAGVGVALPADLGHAKGLVGQLLERWLGAAAGNRAQPDFAALGVELKTLPVDQNEKPLQSTYVTTAPLRDLDGLRWQDSAVRHKLQHVLWVPVQADPGLPLAQRVVGQAFLWRPSPAEEALLRADWEFHLARIRAGDVERIRGRDGAVLQLRPKARSGQTTTRATLRDAGQQLANPRGFYLRPAFTDYLIQRYFHGRELPPPVALPEDPAR